MVSAPSERIPVSLVTGFLGSGKTTLIATLLRQPAMAGTAVIVNEFGEVGIDDAVFADAIGADGILLLANGCLCCTVREDLARTMWSLIRREDPPTRIVIETTGLAEPAPILNRLMGDPRLRQSTRLDVVIATVDAVNGRDTLDRHPVAARQAALADRRIITKGDIAPAMSVEDLRSRLAALNPGAGIRVANFGAVGTEELLGASLYDFRQGTTDLSRWLRLQDHRAQPLLDQFRGRSVRFSGGTDGVEIGTWLLEEARPVSWEVLAPRLGGIIARHGHALLRVKGVVRTADDPRPLVIHGVQRLFHSPFRLRQWRMDPISAVVAIGDRSAGDAVAEIADAFASAAAVSSPGQSVADDQERWTGRKV
ncbi:MAG TPA: GTP-binding protein [Bauldia sp.]|nr:GTP-binding protein [Bauldia sp.]